MKRYFVTSTGTDIGKTLITSALTWQLNQQGKKVQALKPVIAGFDAYTTPLAETDTGQLLHAQSLPVTKENIEMISPWRFSAAISPDMSAEQENKYVPFDKVVAFCNQQSDAEYQLIEGVGGIMVPLDAAHTVLDWVAVLGCPIIVVTGSYLGSISHTLTACSVIRARGLPLHAVVISTSEQTPVPIERMQETLRHFLPYDTQLHTVSRLDSKPDLWKYVPDLTSIIA